MQEDDMGKGSPDRGMFVELEELVELRHAEGGHHAGGAHRPGSALRSKQSTSGQFRRTRSAKPNARSVLLVVDQRLCMFFGSAAASKSAFAARTAALVAWRTIAVGAQVSAVIVGEHRYWSLPPARSSGEVMSLLEQLVEAGRALDGCRPTTGDPFCAAFDAVAEQNPDGTLVLLISDLRGLSDHTVATLARVRQQNDLLLAWVIDPLEIALPEALPPVPEGLGEGSWPASDAALRNALTAAFEQERGRVRQLSLKLAAPYRQLRTDRPLLEQLRSAFGPGPVSVGRAG